MRNIRAQSSSHSVCRVARGRASRSSKRSEGFALLLSLRRSSCQTPPSWRRSTRRLGGVIPVILRSTEAGEDGNPVAFDPSSVDIASVRFGDQDTLTAGDGARESHGKGHGRPDLMLHFRLGDSGLPIGHTGACVIGEFALEDGAPATFFGCDGPTVR